jgi:curved DNA-binding protein CbpA
MSGERDAYDVLQVVSGAEQEVIVAAYRALARKYHPDGSTPSLTRMTAINAAYNEVRTPDRRARYDGKRGLVAMGPGVPDASGHDVPRAGWPGPLTRRMGALEPDSAVIDFGRYEGWRVADLARYDPEYLCWLSRHSAGIRYRDEIARCLPGDARVGRRAGAIY